MGLDSRTLRDQLRREAAQVPIPQDMWAHISRELDRDQAREQRRRRFSGMLTQWRPTIAFAAAAGIFWLSIIPSSLGGDQVTAEALIAPHRSPSAMKEVSFRSRSSGFEQIRLNRQTVAPEIVEY